MSTALGGAAARPAEGALARRAAHLLLLVALAWQLAAAWQSPQWILERLTVDDTYLLLQVAHRWTTLGFPTFDGLHRTNGFQAAWGLVAWGLAWIARDPETLLHLALSLCAALNTLAGWLLGRFARRLAGGDHTALWVVAFWTAFCLSGRPNLIGLENALLTTTIAGMLVVLHGVCRGSASAQRWWLLAALLGLMVWTRLDTAVFAAIVWGALGIRAARERQYARFAVGCAILAVMALLLIGFNFWAGGTATPVSGMVKRHIATRAEFTWTFQAAAAVLVDTLAMLLKHSAIGVGAIWPPACGAVARIALLGLSILALARGVFRFRPWTAIWAASVVAHVLIFRLWLGAYHLDTLWYYAPLHISACVWLGYVCSQLHSRVSSSRWRYQLPALVGLAKTPLAILALVLPPMAETTSSVRYETAQWLRSAVPADQRAAAWNAGELAYFSQCTLINLDGLVNDRAYFDDLRAGRGTAEYLDAERVNWVVDYASTIGDPEDPFWYVLARDRWEIAARFGDSPRVEQVVVRRKE